MLVGGLIGVSRAYFSDSEGSLGNVTRGSNNWTSWYDYSSTKIFWNYRQAVSITNSSSAITNYQLQMTIPYETGMQSDFGDLRFTSSDGVTALYFWIESYTASSSATVWVKIPTVAASGTTTTIYMYYGNSAAASGSNGSYTFFLFDDFEDGTTTNWTASATNGSKSAVTGISGTPSGSYCLKLTDSSTSKGKNYGVYATFTNEGSTTSLSSCVVDYYARALQTNCAWEMRICSSTSIGAETRFNSSAYIDYTQNGSTWTNLCSYGTTGWYTVKFDKVLTSGTTDYYDFYVTNPSGTQYSKSSATFIANRSTVNRLYFITTTDSQSGTLYLDLIRVRTYTANTVSYTISSTVEE